MRKRSETKPKRGFPLAALPPPPAWTALVEQDRRGKGRDLGGHLQRWPGAHYLSTKAWRPQRALIPGLALAFG